MKKIFTLMCILALLLIPNVIKADKSDPIPSGTAAASRVLPIASRANEYPYNPKTSFSQSIYTKSELGASAKEITAIEFFIHTSVANSSSRTLQVWIKEIDKDSFVINESDAQFYLVYDEISGTPKQYLPGTKVFDGSVTIPTSGSYTITFDDAFDWSGNKNICVTVADLTCTGFTYTDLRHAIVPTDRPRFNYRYTNSTSSSDWLWVYNNSLDFYGLKGASELRGMKWTEGATAVVGTQCNQHKYAPKAVFTFGEDAPTAPETPDDLAVSSVSSSSATLGWSSVSGATSYDLQQSANGSDWSTLSSGETGTSYTWTGLSASSTQYARIRAHNDAGDSDWSDAVTVTTDAVHEHNDISFSKWAATDALPTSGNYYLNDDVAFGWSNSDVTLTGNLNLCLNGKTADIFYLKIIVPSGKTLTIYDNMGGGKITGVVASEVGAFEDDNKALIVVKSGGTLVLKEGAIENNYDPDEDGSSYAIYSNGTLSMAGAPTITSKAVDIYLSASGVITLSGALTNSEKYSVMKYSGTTLTSGWSTNMSGEDPKDYLISADDEKSVYLNGSEAALRTLLNLSESLSNSSISSSYNKVVDVNLTRSLTSSQYNTFCLPFALSNAQLQAAFGSGYDLEEFVGASLDGDQLSLTFNKVTSLTAGKPYLLQPSVDVVNPSFEGVTIGVTAPADQTSDTYISFHGTFAPTELEGGNKNLLFLGAGNELFWPDSDGDLKGFRAYFEVKGGAAKIAKRARIVSKEDSATGIENINQASENQKFILNGQLFIRHNGTKYNVQGQVIK